MHDILDSACLEPVDPASSLIKKIYHFGEVSSTNDICKELVSAGIDSGTIVIADQQTSGRGRFNRKWFSQKDKGLYFSIILRPEADQKYFPMVTLLTSVAVAKAVRSLDLTPSIKWPNDVLVNSRKISGILAEQKKEMLIIGIGLNVNNTARDFPKELKCCATSLKAELGKDCDKKSVFLNLLKNFEKEYICFNKGRFEDIRSEAKSLSNMIGRPVKVLCQDDYFCGIAKDFDEFGSLILQVENDKIIKITSGEITHAS